jgi:Pentapeptide repeats (8 copies)
MANEDHVARLKQDIAAWNRWRVKAESVVPDLRGADLPQADLSKAELYDANLRAANLRAANLRAANLYYANLSEADLSGAGNVRIACLPYRSGRSPDWPKMKNPEAPAKKREAEDEWGK